MELIRLLDLGYDDASIAEHLHIKDYRTLDTIKNEILATLTPAYLDAVDRFRARSYQRYERLYRVAEAHAIGEQLPEREIKTILPDVAQKDWMKIALTVLEAEAKLMQYDLDLAAKRELDAESNNFTDLHASTLNLNSDLARAGSELIKDTWGEDKLLDYIYEKPQPLPVQTPPENPDQLLEELDPREIHAQLRDLQARLHRSQLNGDAEGGSDDESTD